MSAAQWIQGSPVSLSFKGKLQQFFLPSLYLLHSEHRAEDQRHISNPQKRDLEDIWERSRWDSRNKNWETIRSSSQPLTPNQIRCWAEPSPVVKGWKAERRVTPPSQETMFATTLQIFKYTEITFVRDTETSSQSCSQTLYVSGASWGSVRDNSGLSLSWKPSRHKASLWKTSLNALYWSMLHFFTKEFMNVQKVHLPAYTYCQQTSQRLPFHCPTVRGNVSLMNGHMLQTQQAAGDGKTPEQSFKCRDGHFKTDMHRHTRVSFHLHRF